MVGGFRAHECEAGSCKTASNRTETVVIVRDLLGLGISERANGRA